MATVTVPIFLFFEALNQGDQLIVSLDERSNMFTPLYVGLQRVDEGDILRRVTLWLRKNNILLSEQHCQLMFIENRPVAVARLDTLVGIDIKRYTLQPLTSLQRSGCGGVFGKKTRALLADVLQLQQKA